MAVLIIAETADGRNLLIFVANTRTLLIQLGAAARPIRAKRKVGGARDIIDLAMQIRKFTSFAEEAEADRESYRRMSPDERVALVQELRHQWEKLKGERHEGLRRTVRVLERPTR